MKSLRDGILASGHVVAMPILAYPGTRLAGCSVREMVTDAAAQVAVQRALHERFGTRFLLGAMDLSIEPEEFGAEVRLADWDIPTVPGRLLADADAVERLAVPEVGGRRTRVALEAVRRMAAHGGGCPVLAGMMGPFTLAARLYGIGETLVETADRPELVHALAAKATRFLLAYGREIKAAGARGVIVAEPMAGLISPEALREFSSPYVRELVDALGDEGFEVVLHNCGARLPHLAAVLESGARTLHFGQPMDIVAARAEVPDGVVVCGNLDPAAVFVGARPEETAERTRGLLRAVGKARPGFVVSSGCDLPPDTPLANVEAFFRAVREHDAAA